MRESADYRAIRQWLATSGSNATYIKSQVEKARRDHAPEDAIYKRDHIGGDGAWATVRDLAPDHRFRVWYEESA